MIGPVMMKGNKSGIRLILSPEASIKQIQACLMEKLQHTGRYYSNIKPISVTFEGKNLTEDEKQLIFEILIENGINIRNTSSANEKDKEKQTENTKKKAILTDKNGLFYIGNLKNGQSITAAKSIVIVGDIESGACVESEGNIIIIGALLGTAKSGYKGKPDTFVYSLK